MSTRPILVTGGAGFIGCNLVDRLAADGNDVIVYDSLARAGVERNLDWLKRQHPGRVSAVIADLRDEASLSAAAGDARAVFHLAAQVAVTTSLEDPAEDFAVNIGGTFALLDALRRKGDRTPLIFASTNKVYGDLSDVDLAMIGDAWLPADPELRGGGVSEARPLDFHTPYGVSKGAADQYVLDWARSYGIPTAVFRMSCIYGPHQCGTEDQGWVAHFLIQALADRQLTLFGDGLQVRDVLHVRDAVEAYVSALERIDDIAGQAFNLGGGPANAISLIELIRHIEALTGRPVRAAHEPPRQGDQRWYVSDCSRARAALGLPAPTEWKTGVKDLFDWLSEHMRVPAEAAA